VDSGENVLIVEDEDEWRKIYERAVSTQLPAGSIKVAKDLASAERLIDSTKFAVAFVDVGLDIADDQNVDGLRVMEKIRTIGDETSIVVVTGRSGQDVLPITRDAIKKYRAYNTFGKSEVGPDEIEQLLNGGLQAYRNQTAHGRMDARDSIRGTADGSVWDYRVTEAVGFAGESGKFYDFLDQLLAQYLPLIARRTVDQAQVDAGKRLVYGEYWSRAVGSALLVCFGAMDTFETALQALLVGADRPSLASAGERIRELAGHGVKGAVFVLPGSRREEFGPI
jgi:CheY-like chemotaxis protein